MAAKRIYDRSQQASIGVAIMAKDAAKTLPVLLQSIRPYVKQIVVGVDERSTDKTANVAKKFGADDVFPLHVSDYHDCVIHDHALAQHFGNARQETFRHLDRGLDWWMWLDADDVLEGAHLLKSTMESLNDDCIGLWLHYHYAYITRADGTRKVNTLFDRERILRTHFHGEPVQWEWEGRVHETVKPVNAPYNWGFNDQIVVVHQPGIHQTNDSAPRNLLLLEMDYEEDPGNARTVFYLGHTYFALGDYGRAAQWYETFTREIGDDPYQLWQAYIYLSICYENLDEADLALKAATSAVDTIPIHGDPYFRMAAIYNKIGEPEKAIYWNNHGRKMSDAPFFAFKNPLDRSFNQRVVQGEALRQLGRITEAKAEWVAAAQVFVDERLAHSIHDVETLEQNANAAQAFVDLAGAMGVNGVMSASGPTPPHPSVYTVYEHMPDAVKAFGRTRDVVMPWKLMAHKLSTQPRIVFWCGKAYEPWAPPSLNTTGIGGSETAVIEIARRFAADGWTVDVYNEAERFEGIHAGVGYWDLKRFGPDEKADAFVSWRQPQAHDISITAKTKVLWCHDLNYGPSAAEHFPKWDKVLGVSAWHSGMLKRYYPPSGESGYEISFFLDRHDFVPNGIDLSRFTDRYEKVPYRCVYASSPDRGLDTLLNLWPQILASEPVAELHVAYGWETMDKMIDSGQRPDLARFKDAMVAKIESTPNVVWRGRLPQDALAQLYGESVAWLYPTDFLEVSCISAMEAMAGGAIPVVTAAGALPETIGDAGFLVPGPTTTRGFQDTFPRAALGVLAEKNVRTIYSEQARRHASGQSWDFAYQRWLSVLGLDGERRNGHETAPERELMAVGS